MEIFSSGREYDHDTGTGIMDMHTTIPAGSYPVSRYPEQLAAQLRS